MAKNKEIVLSRYGDGEGEDKRYENNIAEFAYTKKYLSRYISKESEVIEIGCATGYYGVFLADKCKKYHGVDLNPAHIEKFQSKIKEHNLTNVTAEVGDATDLNAVESESYDVVLVLGPMYHLCPEGREIVFEESKRICKSGGTLIYAYINKLGLYIKVIYTESWNHIYPNKKSNDYVFNKGTDDERPELFFFTMPEEISARASEHGLSVVKNVGLDFFYHDKDIRYMTDEQKEAMNELADRIADSDFCAGMSNHALLICKKP